MYSNEKIQYRQRQAAVKTKRSRTMAPWRTDLLCLREHKEIRIIIAFSMVSLIKTVQSIHRFTTTVDLFSTYTYAIYLLPSRYCSAIEQVRKKMGIPDRIGDREHVP